MSDISNITTALTSSLRNSDLQGVTNEWSEVFLDTFLAEGILKDIPIINTIIGLGKTGMKINDVLFLKKLLFFISQINDIPAEEREKVINEIEDSKQYRIKIGEKLLYIVDTCDDHEKSEIIGYLFKAFLKRSIDYDSFLLCSLVIERCLLSDLKWFLKLDHYSSEIKGNSNFLNWGLLELAPFNLKIKKSNRETMGNNSGFELDGTEIKLKPSMAGVIIREFLQDYITLETKKFKINEMNISELEDYFAKVKNEFVSVYERDKLRYTVIISIIELCNNWQINDNEFNKIVGDIITYMTHVFIHSASSNISEYNKKQIEKGIEFNFKRWQEFEENYRLLYSDQIQRNPYL